MVPERRPEWPAKWEGRRGKEANDEIGEKGQAGEAGHGEEGHGEEGLGHLRQGYGAQGSEEASCDKKAQGRDEEGHSQNQYTNRPEEERRAVGGLAVDPAAAQAKGALEAVVRRDRRQGRDGERRRRRRQAIARREAGHGRHHAA